MDDRQYAFLTRQPSAALKNRERFLGMPKRGLAFLLANVMFWQPLWAQADGIVVSAPGTGLDRAGNGVPIVNIAKPNGSGLSHNKFTDYNVGSNGIILNNAISRTQSTQLGGIILGNPNLNGTAATTILNEVNGGNPSQLRGYTEVAGQSAHVIVANPYGITCNGCGFINSPKVTLSTGKPVVENGRLDRYQVDQGSVAIEGAGLNANNVDHFEIITRSAKINAEIQAKNLTIVAGRNDVNADTLNATARADDGSAKPELAIDSSALGGMYAGAIKLVGTEAGVGVKLDGKLIASGGDIQLDANGHLSMVDTSASGAVNVKATSLDAKGPVYAGTTLNAQAQGDLVNRQTLAARDGIVLNAGGQLSNNGIIEAGVNGDNTRNASGDVSVTANTLDNHGKSIVASRNLTANVAQTLNNQGGTLSAGQTTTVKAGTLDNQNKGRVLSNGALSVTADKVLNTQGVVSSNDSLTVNVGQLNNHDGEVSSAATLEVTGTALDNSNGLLSAKGATRVTTGTFDNTAGGYLISGDTLDLTATQVNNGAASRIASDKALTASITGLDQQGGELFSKTALTLDLNNGQLNNLKGVINAPLLVLKNLKDVDNRGGEISSAQAFTLAARNLDNRDGKLISNQALTLRIDQALNNIKGLVSAQSIDAHSASLDNTDGLISSRGVLVMTVDGQLINRDAAIIADGDLHIEATHLNNGAGQIAGKTNVTATIDSVNNQGGQMIALGGLTLTGASLDNRTAGLVGATDTLTLNVGSIDNRGGELSGHGDVALTGDALDNSDGGQVIANGALALTVQDVLNRTKGLLSGKTGLTLTGETLDNSGGSLLTQKNLTAHLDGDLNNAKGALSAEGALDVTAASLINTLGSVSSAGALALTLDNAVLNQGGGIVTDAGLILKSASLDNRNQGSISAKQAVTIETGAFDNSQAGRLSSGANLELTTKQLTNQDGGRIASSGALTASVTGLDQQGGQLFSDTSLSLDLNQGQLNNQNGLINAPLLMLKNLKGVNNAGGEISSAQAFTLAAQNLINDNAKLLSNQAMTLRIDNALTNLKGLIAAAVLDVEAASLDNSGGTLTSRANLDLKLTGPLVNQNQGLINATDALTISTRDLNNQQGSLLGSAIAIDFGAATGDLNNGAGLITTAGVLSLKNLRDLDNQGGEISSSQNLDLTARDLNSSAGKLISNGLLTVKARDVTNQGGLMSGFKGLDLSAASLDNRNAGTLSSRDEDVSVTLSGALLNSADGALAGKKKLTITAASIDNRGGILSSGADQTLTVTGGLLNNAQGGLIDSAAALVMNAMTLGNADGTVNAQQALTFTGTTLDNTGGTLIGNAAVTLDLLGALTNTNGKLASTGPLRVERATQLDNQGGQIASQSLLTLLIGGLDNRNRGTVAANDALVLATAGAVQNSADGLIYSQNGAVQIDADSLANGKGTVQSQGNLTLVVDQDIDNRSGRIQAKTGELSVEARNLDNRGGVLASLQGLLKTDLTGVLKNGYDLNNNRQGGITQAQRLSLIALGGLDNYGGRISAQTGDVVITTGNFDNRNGGLYAKGKVNVTANDFDNSGDNDGQIAGSQIDLNLTGALNNRLGIIESDSTLSVKARSLDNQTGKIRALGTGGKTNFQIGGLFDNRSGVLESANTDLSLGVGDLLNADGSVLHIGIGTFGVATDNVVNAGGSFVTHGAMTLNADSWTNTSVLQAGTLNVNVNNFTQTATGQLLATTAFVGSGGNWRNDGLLASDGTLVLTLGGTYSGSGRMTSLGNLTADAGQLELADAASIAGGATTVIKVGGQLTNYGQLSSANDLSVTAANVSNYGAIAASRDLTVTTQALLNAQVPDGGRGFLFSGRNMELRTASFTNRYADVYSLGNLLVSGATAGTSAQNVLNSSASIEAGGDITLAADNIVNQRDKFSMAQEVTGGYMTIRCVQHCDGPDTPRVRGPVFIYNTVESVVSEDSPTATLLAGRNLTVNSTDFLNQYSVVSAANDLSITSTNITNKAALSASGTSGHEVGAGTWITGEYFYRLIDEVKDYNRKHPRSGPFDPVAFNELVGKFDPSLFYGINRPVAVQADGASVAAAIIQAGGTAKLTASNDISSLVVLNTSSSVTGRSANTSVYSATHPSVVLLNRQLPADLSQQQVNPVSLPGFSLPTGQNGLFRLSGQGGGTSAASAPQNWSLGSASLSPAQRQQALPVGQVRDLALGNVTPPSASNMDPIHADTAGGRTTDLTVNRVQGLPTRTVTANPHKYLIETNPLLTDLKQFMSSDYLLENLGYDPDESAKRLGDGFYEQKLIQEAVIARTGQRFIDGQTSNEDMFKYLMNNAIASKTELDLAVGVSLTSEQVAALTHDIVWMESAEVNGEQVLVPVLYLANANNRLSPNGALIEGNNLNLVAGKNLANVGTLKATSNLSASAGENLVNSGLVQAGERLDLLAGNHLVNRAGGIITGRDVSATALMGDVVNERTVTSSQIAYGQVQDRNDFADSAARIEAANDLSLSAGGSLNNIGGALQSGRDIRLNAGNDVNLVAAQTVDNLIRDVNRNSSTITQYGASVSAGRDVSATAGRDLNVVASQIDAKRDVDMAATENVNISSAADEQHFLYKSKKLTIQEDHVRQVKAQITAGGDVALAAGKNLMMVASRITAGDEAYLVAGGKLGLIAAQNSDYSLYDEKKKGSWGSKKTQRDEVTDVKNIGSEITTGGDLVIKSGDDQRYQVAKLESGKDITLDSGGSITFEAVKDLHKEDHAKSKSSMAWSSMSGKGNTDETLRQTQMVAAGAIAIKAVDGLNIDIKQVNQESVHQSIKAMVDADPQLAWLAEAEKRGDVDWRKVREVHDSYKYSHSGMGPAVQMIIAILVVYFTAGAASGLIGTMAGSTAAAGSGTAFAAAGTATTSAVAGGAAAGSTVAAGWANVALTAVATGAASNATVSFINNGGNLGAVFKDVTSSDALRGYVVSGVTAGLTAGIFDKMTSTTTSLEGALPNAGKVIAEGGLGSLEGIGRFGANQLLQNGTSTLLDRALGGDSQFDNALRSSLANTFAAAGFNLVGDLGKKFDLKEGGLAKVGLHAVMGGLAAEAAGGDFKTGALAAGVNELLIDSLAEQYTEMTLEQKNRLLVMNSQIVGVLAAAAQGGDAKSLQTGSWVAGSATSYNRLLHSSEKKALADEAKALEEKLGKPKSDMSWEEVLLLAANAQVDATENARLQALVNSFPPGNPEGQHLAQDLLKATSSIQSLAARNTALTWSDGRTIVANGAEVHAFQATTAQFVDPALFNTASQWSSNNNWANEPEIVPTAWREQFGRDAVTYLREIAGVSSSRQEFDDLVQRVSTIVGGGIERVTWDLDAALAVTGAPAVLRALLARRLAAAGVADAVVVGAKGALNTSLLDELAANGVKFTPENVIATTRNSSGQVVFLETGNSKAGLQHIIEEHGSQFSQMGVSEAEIPGVVMKAVSEGKLVGYQGTGTGRPIYELTINGQPQRIAVTVGDNGFVVGANPRGSLK
ncbi:filamentous hemagglutinin N-terminal domain-containing protein [Pseudomonas sp. D1-2]|uniref:two-partner secretion domain-containing protein n=1 Tax=unclassified Pseudomonas TaxID=196821 RepID=UPI003DA7FDAD